MHGDDAAEALTGLGILIRGGSRGGKQVFQTSSFFFFFLVQKGRLLIVETDWQENRSWREKDHECGW